MKEALHGGIAFAPFEGQPAGPVERVPVPDRVHVPLQQGCDGPVEPRVEVGDRVARGQVIGSDPTGTNAPVHSAVAGAVERVGRLQDEGPAVVSIAADAAGDEVAESPIGDAFARHAPEEVADALFKAGVTAMTRDGIPVARHPRGIDPGRIDTLVVAALDTGVLAVSPEVLAGERVEALAAGIRAVAHALQVKQAWVAVDDQSPAFAGRLEACLDGAPSCRLRPLRRVYPQHWDERLTPVLTGRRVPDDGRAFDVGVVCIDLQTALAAFDAVVRGVPVTEQLLVLGGPGYRHPGIVRAAIGMRVADLVRPRLRDDLEVRLVEGGLLSGRVVDPETRVVTRELRRIDAVREDRERTLLSFLSPGREQHSYGRSYLSYWHPTEPLRCDSNLHGEARPCISCGACNEVCPRELMPYWLSRQVRSDRARSAVRYGLNACIACGLCSYVCPSKIPLMEDIQRGKEDVAREPSHA